MTTLSTESCNADFGWLDPLDARGERTPRIMHDADGERRVCEIRQLEGAALESCIDSLACPECEPGWCATRVPELLADCSTGRPDPFRFVSGSRQAAVGSIRVECEQVD